MNCWTCERPAQGVCIFCGRGTCKEHAGELPHILSIYLNEKNEKLAILIESGLFCGTCRPRDEPVVLRNL